MSRPGESLESAELTPEEFDRRVAAALADEAELQNLTELSEWFVRRYPTARERLAYVRRKYKEWTRPHRMLP